MREGQKRAACVSRRVMGLVVATVKGCCRAEMTVGVEAYCQNEDI